MENNSKNDEAIQFGFIKATGKTGIKCLTMLSMLVVIVFGVLFLIHPQSMTTLLGSYVDKIDKGAKPLTQVENNNEFNVTIKGSVGSVVNPAPPTVELKNRNELELVIMESLASYKLLLKQLPTSQHSVSLLKKGNIQLVKKLLRPLVIEGKSKYDDIPSITLAVIALQKKHKLKRDGLLGKKTLSQFLAEIEALRGSIKNSEIPQLVMK